MKNSCFDVATLFTRGFLLLDIRIFAAKSENWSVSWTRVSTWISDWVAKLVAIIALLGLLFLVFYFKYVFLKRRLLFSLQVRFKSIFFDRAKVTTSPFIDLIVWVVSWINSGSTKDTLFFQIF